MKQVVVTDVNCCLPLIQFISYWVGPPCFGIGDIARIRWYSTCQDYLPCCREEKSNFLLSKDCDHLKMKAVLDIVLPGVPESIQSPLKVDYGIQRQSKPCRGTRLCRILERVPIVATELTYAFSNEHHETWTCPVLALTDVWSFDILRFAPMPDGQDIACLACSPLVRFSGVVMVYSL